MNLQENTQKLLAIWWVRFLLFAVFYFSLNYLSYNFFEDKIPIEAGIYERFLLISLFSRLLPVILLSLLFIWLRKGESLATFGLSFDKISLNQFLQGFLVVLFISVIYFLIGIVFGGNFKVNQLEYNTYFSLILAMIIIGSSWEELFFRGILFQTLVDRWNPIFMSILFSLLFSLSHFNNPGFNFITFLTIFLAGLTFSVIFIQTRSLLPCLSFHFAWNFVSAYLMGSPVSGFNFHIAQFEIDKTNLSEIGYQLIGGNFGIEEGLLSYAVLLFIIFYSLKYLKPSPFISSKLFKRKILESKLLDKS